MFGFVDSVAVLSKALPFLHPQIIISHANMTDRPVDDT